MHGVSLCVVNNSVTSTPVLQQQTVTASQVAGAICVMTLRRNTHFFDHEGNFHPFCQLRWAYFPQLLRSHPNSCVVSMWAYFCRCVCSWELRSFVVMANWGRLGAIYAKTVRRTTHLVNCDGNICLHLLLSPKDSCVGSLWGNWCRWV